MRENGYVNVSQAGITAVELPIKGRFEKNIEFVTQNDSITGMTSKKMTTSL